MQRALYCLASHGLVFVGDKRTYMNEMPTFCRLNVLQSSHDFGSIRVSRLAVARSQSSRLLVCFLDLFYADFLGGKVSAHT